MSVLAITGLQAGYGDSEVLHDVSLEVASGEVVCLLGANGAGKTTLMRAISGLIGMRAGALSFDGTDLSSIPAHRRVEAGIALSPEGRQVFPNLSVADHLLLGSYNRRARPSRADKLAEVYALFPRLAERRGQAAGLMSGGEQQMLAIGRALMACPRLLLLDEPSLGLAPKLIGVVYEAIRQIASNEVGILLVEQNAQAALSVARRGYVLAEGRITLHGDTAALRNPNLLQAAVLGKSPPEARNA